MINVFEHNRTARIAALLAAAAVTLAIYAGGLHGPFLLDDTPNLETIQRWLANRLDWRSAIDNRSGPLGRPLSMLSFLADAARSGGMDPATFKTTNLIVHLLCGTLVYTLCRQLFLRFETTRHIASTTALFVATWWLMLPIHVSTVLYVVQRMAQLGALFTLLSLTIYVAARKRVARDRSLGYHFVLWVVFPLIVAIGSLAKENAILALPLALLIEWTCFAPEDDNPRPASVRFLFLFTVILPGALAAGWLAIHPQFISGGYQIRSFTLTERLLTESRVLWSYVRTTLLPIGKDMGLIHDNYVLSRGVLSPWTTLIAVLAWGTCAALAIVMRRRYPMISLGIGFFMVGHLLESTIIPLEIYFEHRNYLPDLGVLIAVTGAVLELWSRHKAPTREFRLIVSLLPASTLILFTAATWTQVGNWASANTLFAMQESYNPTSPRLQATLAAKAIEQGDTRSALAHIDLAERFGASSEGMTWAIWRLIAYCQSGQPIPESIYNGFEQRITWPVTLDGMRYWEQIATLSEKGCLEAKRLVEGGRQWIAHSDLPPTTQQIWRSRYNLARIEANAGNVVQAEADARRAWVDSSHNTGIGILLFQLNASLGRREACEAVLEDLRRQENPGNHDLVEAINLFSKALKEGQIGPETHHH